MRNSGLDMVLSILGHMEQRETKRHVKNACKEWLLASRTVIDSVIDALEEEQDRPKAARKINISKD